MESPTKPQVYVSVQGGIAEIETHGEVDVVHIDWDNVTPDHGMDPAEVLDPMEDAYEGSLRLPESLLGRERPRDARLAALQHPRLSREQRLRPGSRTRRTNGQGPERSRSPSMSRDSAHPALHTPPMNGDEFLDRTTRPHNHLVPEGWEDFNRGICPCGEVVVWNTSQELWVADRQMRVLVLTQRETRAVEDMLALGNDGDVPTTRRMVGRQLLLQDEVETYAASND